MQESHLDPEFTIEDDDKKVPTFEEVVEMNTRFDLGEDHNKEAPLTEQQKEYWLHEYHEFYEQTNQKSRDIANS